MTEREGILVHLCCASCASYVLEHLLETYDVTAYFFNPNVHPIEEYTLRLEEMKFLCRRLGIPLIEGPYNTEMWWRAVGPFKNLPEKSERCWACYRLRLDGTARMACELGMPIFTSSLSVSPHKIYTRIAEAGEEAAKRNNVRFLARDFKKREGFKVSVERSRELGLTRQDYCGCSLSLEESKRKKEEGRAD